MPFFADNKNDSPLPCLLVWTPKHQVSYKLFLHIAPNSWSVSQAPVNQAISHVNFT